MAREPFWPGDEPATREAVELVSEAAPGDDTAQQSVGAVDATIGPETPPESLSADEPYRAAEELYRPAPDQYTETTPPASETTLPAEAASAEDMSQAIEPAAVLEENTAPEPQPMQEEDAAPGKMEDFLPEPAPPPIAETAFENTSASNERPGAEGEKPQHASFELESESRQMPEPVPSEEVTEPIKIAAEVAPEVPAETAPEAAAEAAPEEASVLEPVEEQAENPAAESAPVPAAGPVDAPTPEPPPAPQPPIPEPPPGPVPLPPPVPVAAAPTLPFAEKPAARTTAEKVAAALKAREARGEDADQSPFSVLVNQVYDGPLDLLLDLIRKQDIDIYDIPIAKITAQFLAYVDRLRASDMDVAGDFIYTAALLIHIKSKMLLPRAPAGPDDAEDPRRELVERLLEHERFKNAAQMLLEKQMLEAATWSNPGVREFKEDSQAEPEIAADTTDLVRVFSSILERARNRPIIDVQEDSVTVGQMIQFLARRLTMEDRPVALRRMLSHTNSERALIAMFLALLELVRLQAILLRQDRQFSEIFIKKHTGFDALMNQGLA
ncbi:MAG: segregation/condensation protein A, partial [Terracidiphilus sp.]